MDQDITEGLICPICMKDQITITQLQEHFETAHKQSEDSDVVLSIKEFFGKAKKKILKQDTAELNNEDTLDVTNISSASCFIEEYQEIGVTQSHLELFRKLRHDRISSYALETNKLLNRLYRLITDAPSDTDRRKDHEREVVPWVSDKDVKLCPNCATSFNISKRRHHCRLCGGIMCNTCSQFLNMVIAKKLTQNMFQSNASFGSPSPSPIKPNLQRRDSNNSLLALVSPKEDPNIRLCRFCKIILDKQDDQIELRTNKPVITQLYERMQIIVIEIEKVLPLYVTAAESLSKGESGHTLSEVHELRMRLTKLAENVDAISRKIGVLGSQDDPPPPPVVLQLQGCIRMTANVFLRENLLGLPPVPDEKTVAIQRAKREEKMREEMERKRSEALEAFQLNNAKTQAKERVIKECPSPVPHRPTHLDAEVKNLGWIPQTARKVEENHENPLITQINIIRSYIEQAKKDHKLEEVKMLEENLAQLEKAYAAMTERTQF